MNGSKNICFLALIVIFFGNLGLVIAKESFQSKYLIKGDCKEDSFNNFLVDGILHLKHLKNNQSNSFSFELKIAKCIDRKDHRYCRSDYYKQKGQHYLKRATGSSSAQGSRDPTPRGPTGSTGPTGPRGKIGIPGESGS